MQRTLSPRGVYRRVRSQIAGADVEHQRSVIQEKQPELWVMHASAVARHNLGQKERRLENVRMRSGRV